jgi:hypothetical protein
MSALQTVAEFCDDHRISTAAFVLSLDAARGRASGHQARKSKAAAEWRRSLETGGRGQRAPVTHP